MNVAVEHLKHLLIKRKETVVTAESCTGGRVASLLTSLSGASEFYLGSVVSYSNEIKNKVLNVPKKILKEKGAVSSETVGYMASGAIALMDADWSLVSSGVAGPLGGSERTPVGCVWMAIGHKSRDPLCWKEQFLGNRESVMTQTTDCLISHFIKLLVSRA